MEIVGVSVEELAKLKAIAQQAATVRALQKRYFGARTQSALEDSKTAERELDRMLSALNKPADRQQGLGL